MSPPYRVRPKQGRLTCAAWDTLECLLRTGVCPSALKTAYMESVSNQMSADVRLVTRGPAVT